MNIHPDPWKKSSHSLSSGGFVSCVLPRGTHCLHSSAMFIPLRRAFFPSGLSRNMGWLVIPEGKHWELAQAAHHKHSQLLEAGSAFPNRLIPPPWSIPTSISSGYSANPSGMFPPGQGRGEALLIAGRCFGWEVSGSSILCFRAHVAAPGSLLTLGRALESFT